MEEKKITLDSSTFKALASGTRVSILKTLEKRNHTQSELSAVLKMSIPTIKDHLKEMENAGLVKRKEEGRKWIYYCLTEKSKCILDPERKRLWIVLGFFLFSVLGSIFTITKYLGGRAVDKAMLAAAPLAAQRGGVPEAELMQASAEVLTDSAAKTAVDATFEASNIVATSTPPEIMHYLPYVMTLFIVIAVISLILSIYFLKKSRVLRKR